LEKLGRSIWPAVGLQLSVWPVVGMTLPDVVEREPLAGDSKGPLALLVENGIAPAGVGQLADQLVGQSAVQWRHEHMGDHLDGFAQKAPAVVAKKIAGVPRSAGVLQIISYCVGIHSPRRQ